MLLRRIQRVIRKTENILRWILTIWKDEHWDGIYILIVLRKKLQRMLEYRHSDICMPYVGEERDNRNIWLCIQLLGRLIKDNYVSMLDMRYFPDVICNTPFFTGNKWMVYEDRQRQQDLDYLCKILNKNLFNWWD